jgi:hypothetical protein
MFAPLAVFCFDRPNHLEKVLSKITSAELSINTTLFIFCDGPPKSTNQEQLNRILMTRKLAKSHKWCGEVILFEHDFNMGLRDSIIFGVNHVLKSFSSIIVLEDDVLINKYFIKNMNYLLNNFMDDERIFHISGFKYFSGFEFLYKGDVFISNFMNCSGGWATYKRSWEKFRIDELMDCKLENIELPIWGKCIGAKWQIRANKKNEIKTWAIYWLYFIYIKNGLCVGFKNSQSLNIGFDSLGTHTKSNNSPLVKMKNIDKLEISNNFGRKTLLFSNLEVYFSLSNNLLLKSLRKILYRA